MGEPSAFPPAVVAREFDPSPNPAKPRAPPGLGAATTVWRRPGFKLPNRSSAGTFASSKEARPSRLSALEIRKRRVDRRAKSPLEVLVEELADVLGFVNAALAASRAQTPPRVRSVSARSRALHVMHQHRPRAIVPVRAVHRHAATPALGAFGEEFTDDVDELRHGDGIER